MFIVVKTNAQTDTTKIPKKGTVRISNCQGSMGYFYQGEHFFEGGIKIDYVKYKSKLSRNISFITGGQITKHKSAVYINPYVMLRGYIPLTKSSDKYTILQNTGLVVSVSYNYRKVLGETSQAITPEIGFNINQTATFSYGYNFFINNKYSWATNNRFALRIMFR